MVPIPQANDLNKVLKVPALIKGGVDTPAAIIKELDLGTVRQGLYYINAAEILGLIAGFRKHELTSLGVVFTGSNPERQKKIILESIRKIDVVKKIELEAETSSESSINKNGVAKIIESLGYSSSTAIRRADTLWNWFYWIQFHFPDYCVCEKDSIKILLT